MIQKLQTAQYLGSIIEFGAVVVDKNLKEIEKFNIVAVCQKEKYRAKALLLIQQVLIYLQKEIIHTMILWGLLRDFFLNMLLL